MCERTALTRPPVQPTEVNQSVSPVRAEGALRSLAAILAEIAANPARPPLRDRQCKQLRSGPGDPDLGGQPAVDLDSGESDSSELVRQEGRS